MKQYYLDDREVLGLGCVSAKLGPAEYHPTGVLYVMIFVRCARVSPLELQVMVTSRVPKQILSAQYLDKKLIF